MTRDARNTDVSGDRARTREDGLEQTRLAEMARREQHYKEHPLNEYGDWMERCGYSKLSIIRFWLQEELTDHMDQHILACEIADERIAHDQFIIALELEDIQMWIAVSLFAHEHNVVFTYEGPDGLLEVSNRFKYGDCGNTTSWLLLAIATAIG